MNSLMRRSINFGKSRKGGFLVLALSLLATLTWVQIRGRSNTGGGGGVSDA